ncbi:hypothetical protein MVEN_00820000 [Mycena venus]|uniref:Uncharacterized protein n=1 Tax=Mycena venus TaxID=2733690 RepID=A0A8H6YG97_9AGAR|nr:hypothetical protein MVEN_00820000 [Mycena venus]
MNAIQPLNIMADDPPSYSPSGSSGLKTPSNEKQAVSVRTPAIASISTHSKSAALLRPQDPRFLKSTTSHAARRSPSMSGLFDIFRKSRPLADVPLDIKALRPAVIEDVRLILQPNTGTVAERLALLASCAELCTQHKIDFSTLLQDKSLFHAHTALYWAIVNNLASPQAPFELVGAMLANSQPLKAETIKDARRACISLRSQDMFQYLRMSPDFGALSAEDRFALGLLVPPEEITIELMEGPEQPFSVKFYIPMFQKRMLLNKDIRLEFIARDRLWLLAFFTPDHPSVAGPSAPSFAKDNQWGAYLRLRENSRSTPVDIGIVILDTRPTATNPAHAWNHPRPKLPLENEDEPRSDSKTWGSMWPTFNKSYTGVQADHPCIALDGSITGILGVKLQTGKAMAVWPPQAIPTKPEDVCVIC